MNYCKQVPGQTSPDIAAVREFAKAGWTLDDMHGMPHWLRVERNGMLLVSGGVDATVVRLFAYLHDKCRQTNDRDIYHGHRAAEMLPSLRGSLLAGLDDGAFDKLVTACRLHSVEKCTGDITIDTCFDADRLDLGRVGIIPAPDKMATEMGRHFASDAAAFCRACAEFELSNRQARDTDITY